MPEYKNVLGGRKLRKHHQRCPKCQSFRIAFRSRTRDYRCRNPSCRHIWEEDLPEDYSKIPMQRDNGLYRHDIKRILKFLKPGVSMRELALVTKIPLKTLQDRVSDLVRDGEMIRRVGMVEGRIKPCYYPGNFLQEQTQSINTENANI